MPDGDVNQSIDPNADGGVCAPEATDPAEPAEKKSTAENVVETAHLATEGAGLVSDIATGGEGVVGKAAGVLGPAIGIGETVYSAATGEGCAADKAMGIVPLMGPLSTLFMPSWCGPGPAESTNPDTGMTPSQERDACYSTPADPNDAANCKPVPHFQ